MATPDEPLDFSHIVHATDFSQAGEPAFDHALRLALGRRSHFYLVHAEHLEPGQEADWDSFPGVRSTLARWGLLPAGSAPSAVHERLGVKVTKADVPDRDPADGVLRFITHNQCDFLVVATRAIEGGADRSIAETLARRSQIPTLFLPLGQPGFVEHDGQAAAAQRAVAGRSRRAARCGRFAGVEGCGRVRLRRGAAPCAACRRSRRRAVIATDERHHGRVRHVDADGNVVETIVAQATALDADLIVMATRGHDGLLDHLRGSTTEQVLHRAGRPLLAVPVALARAQQPQRVPGDHQLLVGRHHQDAQLALRRRDRGGAGAVGRLVQLGT